MPSHHGVTATFLHTKTLFCFLLRHEGLCLQVLRMRISIHFGLLSQDDAVTWKETFPEKQNPLFLKATSWL